MKYIKIFFRLFQFVHLLIHEAIHALATLEPMRMFKSMRIGKGREENKGKFLITWPWEESFTYQGAVSLDGEWLVEHCRGIVHILAVFAAPIVVELTFTVWLSFWLSRNLSVFLGVFLGVFLAWHFLRVAARHDLVYAKHVVKAMFEKSAGG